MHSVFGSLIHLFAEILVYLHTEKDTVCVLFMFLDSYISNC